MTAPKSKPKAKPQSSAYLYGEFEQPTSWGDAASIIKAHTKTPKPSKPEQKDKNANR